MRQGRDILVGGHEREMLRMSGWNEHDPYTAVRLERSLRLAVLFSARQALVTAAGYFETTCGYSLLLHMRPSQERGQLLLQGSAGSPSEYLAVKLDQWRGSSKEQTLYGEVGVRRIAALDSSAWRAKVEPTDNLILVNWNDALEDQRHPLLPVFERSGWSSGRAERAIAALPAALDGTVLLVDNIIRHVQRPVLVLNNQDRNRLRVHLARGFFGSHLSESRTAMLVGSTMGMQDAVCPPGADHVDGRFLCEQLASIGLKSTLLERVKPEDFAAIADSTAWRSLRPRLLALAERGEVLTAREQKAVRNAGSMSARPKAPSPSLVEAVLSRQGEALERLERRAGTGPGPGISVDGIERLRASISAHPSAIDFNRFPSSPPNEVDLDQVSKMILQILSASSPEDARNLIRAFDSTLGKFEDLHPGVVVDLIKEREELADKFRTIPSGFRLGLYQVCLMATGGVLAKGLEIVLKAVVG